MLAIKAMNSKTAKKIKSKNTLMELMLRKELWRRGYRYRINDKSVFGTPDITFRKQKVAIFCDSEFWHGKKYLTGEKFKTNVGFWIGKIKRNIKRDILVNERLKSDGWIVLRFWGNNIKREMENVLTKIENSLMVLK